MQIAIELVNKKDKSINKRFSGSKKIVGQIAFNIGLKSLEFHWR